MHLSHLNRQTIQKTNSKDKQKDTQRTNKSSHSNEETPMSARNFMSIVQSPTGILKNVNISSSQEFIVKIQDMLVNLICAFYRLIAQFNLFIL